MDITNELRSKCGHDSRDVDGCVNCEASTLIESMRQQLSSRDAEVVSLTNQRDYEYVRAENAEQERDELREQIASLKDELRQISTAIAVVAGIAGFAAYPLFGWLWGIIKPWLHGVTA